MAGINMNSVMKKIQSACESKAAQARINDLRDGAILRGDIKGKRVHTAYDAGAKFGSVLRLTIQQSQLPQGVIDLLEDYDVSKPVKLADGTYSVTVFFDKDTLRDSMSSYKDYYPVDIAELYNNGVDHIMQQLFEHGVNGQLYVSAGYIPGAHFIEQAIIDFEGNYASEYNVLDIIVNGEDMNSARGKAYRAYKSKTKHKK